MRPPPNAPEAHPHPLARGYTLAPAQGRPPPFASLHLPLRVKELRVVNKGWELLELSDAEQAAAEETLAIRGYRLLKHETRTIHVKARPNPSPNPNPNPNPSP